MTSSPSTYAYSIEVLKKRNKHPYNYSMHDNDKKYVSEVYKYVF